MNKNNWIFLAAAVLTLGSCSSDGEQPETGEAPVELRLSSSLDLQTRAYTLMQAEQIESGEKVYAWVDEVGASEYVHAWELTADGAGNFTGDKKNYPMSGAKVDVYALHGNFTGITAGTTAFPSSLTHSVAADQTTGYGKSDLLCAATKNCARQISAHNLEFKHLLSKIEVYLVAGTGMTDAELESAQVTILNTKPTTTVTLSKLATPIASISAASGTAAPITAHMQTKTGETVTISSTPQNAHRLAEAVIVPQVVSSDGTTAGTSVDFIQITVGTSTFKAPISKEFTAGNKYTYNVVVNKSGLSLTSTIAAWGDGGTTTIPAK